MVETAKFTWQAPLVARFRGGVVASAGLAMLLAYGSYDAADPSLNTAAGGHVHNLLRGAGAVVADLSLQSLGLAAWPMAGLIALWGLARAATPAPDISFRKQALRAFTAFAGVLMLAGVLASPEPPRAWPLARGLGGFWGQALLDGVGGAVAFVRIPYAETVAVVLLIVGTLAALGWSLSVKRSEFIAAVGWIAALFRRAPARPTTAQAFAEPTAGAVKKRVEIAVPAAPVQDDDDEEAWDDSDGAAPEPKVFDLKPRAPRPSGRETRENQGAFEFARKEGFHLPELNMLTKPNARPAAFDEAALRQNARMLEGVLAEFGVRGTIDQIRPGPVVTLYELVPAAGVKHARVVALSDDIARSMSARACRVSVVQGRNAIGIELPNAKRETVFLRDLLASAEFERQGHVLPLALGETIGGEPYVADLARMPHLLIAGTTGSGKSVGVNAMILSILYRLSPAECRFIMIDPKMLELSVYDGIPHLLAPVVTDPKKAVVALKWTVREMEDRYRRMSKIGVRNVASYNERAREALAKGEHFERTVQTGFDESGRPVYESEKIRPEAMPYLVVVMDEMADLMLVAGKDVEGAVQRLAQMARAAGIHLIMATQRPSVDVITGTIKANFPTRISFQVTSKIDSRTILGEQGAEQLLGQGDMLYMAGGGRVTRLHGPFVDDAEVVAVAEFLRNQGEPQYLEEVTLADEEGDAGDDPYSGGGNSGDDLYDRAVAVVIRDRKASTSYVQRRLQIGYNRAASLIERMEREGVVGPANHAGKRDILVGGNAMAG
ncbi:MAG TPA: DNA translocase FtsK [Caulobacteraceae bacterium]|nr:DNA translocase FtsK [Caulobacteraceae bacterium]